MTFALLCRIDVACSRFGAAYERSHPVVDFELTEDGPVYLVVGGTGNREGHAGATPAGWWVDVAHCHVTVLGSIVWIPMPRFVHEKG